MAVDVPRVVLLIVLLLFLFLSPDSRTSSLSQQRELPDTILLEKHALNVLNASSYGDFDSVNGTWLNVTGLRANDNYAWVWLPKVQERARRQAESIIRLGVSNLLRRSSLNGSEVPSYDFIQTTPINNASEYVLDRHSLFYQNASGIVRGQWSRSEVGQAPLVRPLNFTALAPGYIYASHEVQRNITGLDGDLKIQFEEDADDELTSDLGFVRGMRAAITIKDETSSGNGWEIAVFGVHFPQEGSMLFATTSEKFAGIFALPHFALSERTSKLSQTLLSQTLKKAIEKQEDNPDAVLNPWYSTPSSPSDGLFPTARCEYIVYLQQHPLAKINANLHDIEQELRFPTGFPIHSAPSMKFSALIFSPDCGFVLESKGPPDFAPEEGVHLIGPKIEVLMTRAKRIILCLAAVVSAQIFLAKRQMQDTSTPSTRSRVSLYTIVMMALGEGFMFICCLVAGMYIDSLFLPLLATGFIFFLGVSFFGMKFIMDIWTVQAPERQEHEREQQRRRDERNAEAAARTPATVVATHSVATLSTSSPTPSNSLPPPATAHRTPNTTATPVILPPDQDIDAAAAEDANTNNAATTAPTTVAAARREMSALYTKFYFGLLGILLLSIYASSWPAPLRSAYCNTLSLIYLSFWLPQIYRNIIRNCRKALRWEFICGQSLLRLLPFAYFYLYELNILFVKTDSHAFYALAAWVWIQVLALVSQEILGPRFFVKEGWAPPAYDYHPILREGESGSEAGSLLPIGFSESLRSTTTDLPPTSPTTSTSPSSLALNRQPTNTSIRRTRTTKDDSKSSDNNSNNRIFDCAICTEDLEVPVIASSTASGRTANNDDPSSGGGNASTVENVGEVATMIFERRKYMVTPCRHIFHSTCLEGWMRYRLQCPICRENLPPV